MRLTKKKAIQIAIELWEWLAETGRKKEDWPKWKEYGNMAFDCPFCKNYWGEGDTLFLHKCPECPYFGEFGDCCKYESPFSKWIIATTEEDKKKYAALFLEQLRSLK